jgi:uncharacterized protein (TIGR03083 family)
MNKTDLLAALQREHDAMEQAIAGLTPEQLDTPFRADGWSIKDLLAHITAWESEMVTALFHAAYGRQPALGEIIAKMDAWNAERYAENRTRPVERVLADWRGVRQALIHRVKEWDEAALNAEVAWRRGRTLVQLIEANSYGHEAEHREEIETWKQKQ